MSEQASGSTHNGEATFLEVGPFYIVKVWPPERQGTDALARSKMRVLVAGELRDFSRESFVAALSTLLNISPAEIIVRNVTPGSVLVELELPAGAAAGLYRLAVSHRTTSSAQAGAQATISSEDKIRYIRELPLFSRLTEEELSLLEPLFEVKFVPKGEYLFHQGERSYALYQFISGKGVLLYRGRRATVGKDFVEPPETADGVDPGEFVGERSLFLDEGRRNSLQVTRSARVMVLPRRRLEAFLRTYPDIHKRLNIQQNILEQRLDILLQDDAQKYPYIRRMKLFEPLADDEVQALAALFKVERFFEGEYLYRQGEFAFALYLFVEGEAEQLEVRANGVEMKSEKPVLPGQYVGEKAIFSLDERSHSLVISKRAVMLILTKRDFDAFLRQHRAVPEKLGLKRGEEPCPSFPWLNEYEQVLICTHRHPWAWIRRSLWVIPVMVVLAVPTALTFQMPLLPPWLWLCGVALILVAPFASVFYNIVDWRNDWFVVTSQRVVHEENVLLAFHETRDQAPLGSIQSVRLLQEGFWAEQFDFGDVMISTAGAGGTIRFDTIPDPEKVSSLISTNLEKFKVYRASQQRSEIREMIDDVIGTDVLNRTRAGEQPMPEWSVPPAPVTLWQQIASYFDINVRFENERGDIIYRKHWLVLWNDIFRPTFVLILNLILLLVCLFGRNTWPWQEFSDTALFGYFGITFPLLLLWWWWMYEDWHNDLYIVEKLTPNIQRIHRRPFWLRDERSTIPISKIQRVDTRVEGFWQAMLNYGMVVIQTAAEEEGGAAGASGDIIFPYIYRPEALQADILRRQRQLQEGQQQAREDETAKQIAQWLAIYHQATHPEDYQDGYKPTDRGGDPEFYAGDDERRGY